MNKTGFVPGRKDEGGHFNMDVWSFTLTSEPPSPLSSSAFRTSPPFFLLAGALGSLEQDE